MIQSIRLKFTEAIPRGVRITVAVLMAAMLLPVLYWGYVSGVSDAKANHASGIAQLGVPVVLAYCAGILFAGLWLVALGFVYGDAKRRGMRAGLWTLVAALTPSLIGYLLYFALRQPVLATCENCGSRIEGGQRFCCHCGSQLWQPGPMPPGGGTAVAIEATNQQISKLSIQSFSAGFAVGAGTFLARSLFAYLRHDVRDCAILFGLAAVCFGLLAVSHRRPHTLPYRCALPPSPSPPSNIF